MTTGRVRAKIIAERTSWIRKMIESLRSLPGDTCEAFRADHLAVAAAESYLRRALEALLDLGRHILAKGFGRTVVEYKDIPLKNYSTFGYLAWKTSNTFSRLFCGGSMLIPSLSISHRER